MDRSCVNNILRFASRCIELCNSKATLLYEYLTLTFIFLDAHDDPGVFFSSCSSIQFISAPRNLSFSLSRRTILNSSYRLTVYSKIVSLGFGRETIFLSFFSFFSPRENFNFTLFGKYREIREKYN